MKWTVVAMCHKELRKHARMTQMSPWALTLKVEELHASEPGDPTKPEVARRFQQSSWIRSCHVLGWLCA